jgi:hypothetical protein
MNPVIICDMEEDLEAIEELDPEDWQRLNAWLRERPQERIPLKDDPYVDLGEAGA